ncbi:MULTISPECIES: type VI secretion system-associated protein TagC-5 [Burkholderia]|uniref:DUF3540 domain-containing protein n=9 Tax=Burkholderia pseudomallei TaxID=28450 RepID=A0AAX0U2P8_BURPE|nr:MULTISPECIES: type VI secretion system-associated protein TagC-5 [Burkholderia]AIO15708.1 hypothetical protein DP58_3938 [Burkholderia pseudomallei]AIO84086.1 hypothetical protein DP46_4022 [Burkholderia pseudomallei]AIO93848.1 hypothetical protein DP48_4999 [Burkholderia pseudomallei]AIP55768.1 hypothetical protein DR54_4420 [Burkholderia pseudomallei HBPUB10303a]AJW56411.1 type VI secretion protein [Burkholderia pseudomallei]
MIHGSRTSMTPPPSSSAPLGAAAPLPPVHARRADEAGAALRAARVTGRVGDWLLLDDHAGRARRADGCLLAPDIGDSVLIWTSAPAGALADDDDAAHAPSAYVLAVLARAGAPQAALALPGGIVLETGADGLRIDAPHIALAARERIDARAPRVDVSAHRAHVRAAHLDACARSIDGRAHDVRLVARRFTSTIGRALHTLGDCLRRVCGVDELHAARARWRVDERAHLHARDVTLLADRHVGIDGERIDLG